MVVTTVVSACKSFHVNSAKEEYSSGARNRLLRGVSGCSRAKPVVDTPDSCIYLSLGSKMPPWCWLDCNVVNGRYRYLTDLLSLDSCRPCNEQQTSEPAAKVAASSSVDGVQAWNSGLDSHPVKEFSRYILDSLSKGFRIWFLVAMMDPTPANHQRL